MRHSEFAANWHTFFLQNTDSVSSVVTRIMSVCPSVCNRYAFWKTCWRYSSETGPIDILGDLSSMQEITSQFSSYLLLVFFSQILSLMTFSWLSAVKQPQHPSLIVVNLLAGNGNIQHLICAEIPKKSSTFSRWFISRRRLIAISAQRRYVPRFELFAFYFTFNGNRETLSQTKTETPALCQHIR